MSSEQLLSQLNPSQREAVEYCSGPQLVIAGAGSGKTRVLTYKIAYLLQQGLKPWNIMALTFTNKAAGEMKERIGRLVGSDLAQYLRMGTFHSIFSRILRAEAEAIGYDPQFTIYDEADSRSLLKAIIKEMNLDDKLYRPAAVHSRISMAKNHIVSAANYNASRETTERDRQARTPAIGQIYTAYQQRLRQANAMDFDDLLMLTFKLFRDHEEIRQRYAEKFHYVLVDEYQDTNRVQQSIVEQLTRERQRVCVVGDDAQSIYAFRGANIDNILDFNEVYPSSRLFKLEQNYRSTQLIVQAANSLIKHNERQIPKNIFSENDAGQPLLIKPAYSDKEEAAIVCNDIRRIRREEGAEYSHFAILYRTNAQSRSFEEECRKQGIPYRIFGGLSFYQRKEIKDIIAYFRLVVNPHDEEALKRIINYPARGIGNTTLQRIADAARQNGVSLWSVLTEPTGNGLNVNAGTRSKLSAFAQLISAFREKAESTDAYALGREIIAESGIYADLYSSTDPEYLSRQDNLQEFLAALEDFVNEKEEQGLSEEARLSVFLQDVSLQTDKESDDGQAEKISMMTVHAAKGLEFPVVFVVGMEENIFPSQMAQQSARELEEERRLLYVAITRAEKQCILTYANNRFRYGHMEFDVPSRFLRDIDSRFVRIEGSQPSAARSSSCPSFGAPSRKPFGSAQRSVVDDYFIGQRNSQNSRPVADRFMADPKPRETAPFRPERPVDPLSPSFRRQMEEARRNPYTPKGATAAGFPQASTFRRQEPPVSQAAPPPGFRPVASSSAASVQSSAGSASSQSPALREGAIIEHQRFGVGTVLRVEGTGDNTKATVEFRNTGTKQLLLKFAKFTVIKDA